ncbi:MAG: hypothetical protein IJZ23_12985 [Roseburia sp.]|nr:hypothetical protein [Roseburia sp.]MBQ8518528.1 hypothetical protein [Agathobacter sp.]
MKNRMKKLLLLGMVVVMVFSCVACGGKTNSDNRNTEKDSETTKNELQDFEAVSLDDGKAGEIYWLSFADGPSYEATPLPEKHFLGASMAFTGMKMKTIEVKVKFYEDGTYKYVASDISEVDMSHERWMHREYVWTGTYTKADNVYTLAVPTTATLEFVGAKAYEVQAALIGELGSFTHETNPELITMFQEATATVDGDKITFTVANSGEAEAAPQEGQIKVACIGDSITYGHGVTNWATENYPAVLQSLLGEEYFVANYGFIGACVNPNGDKPYTSQNVYQKSLDLNADIIVLMLGTNDSKASNWTDADTFVKAHKALLDTYFADGRQPKVYIGLCAESYDIENPEMEYGIQPAVVDQIAKALQSAYASENVEIIDIHSLTEAHPEWFSKDGVHPNTEGAKAIAEAVAEAIK